MKKICFLLITALLVLACCQSDKKEHKTTPKPQEVKDTTVVAGVYHYQFDGFELWTLQDMERGMSMDLFPDAKPADIKKLVPTGEAEAAINGFLVKKGEDYILFDAGLGIDQGGALLDKLSMLDIKPEEIHTVMLTHFHGDHIGGMLTGGKATFPNAEVYFSIEEQNAWKRDGRVQRMLDAYEGHTHPFKCSPNVVDGVDAILAPGHTPGHTMYQLGNLLIIGDLIHALALQQSHPEYCPTYDQEPQLAAKTRKEVYDYIQDHELVVAGMHLPHSGVIEEFHAE